MWCEREVSSELVYMAHIAFRVFTGVFMCARSVLSPAIWFGKFCFCKRGIRLYEVDDWRRIGHPIKKPRTWNY